MCVLAAASNIGNERPAVRQGSFDGHPPPCVPGKVLWRHSENVRPNFGQMLDAFSGPKNPTMRCNLPSLPASTISTPSGSELPSERTLLKAKRAQS